MNRGETAIFALRARQEITDTIWSPGFDPSPRRDERAYFLYESDEQRRNRTKTGLPRGAERFLVATASIVAHVPLAHLAPLSLFRS